jgi:hypothetical protein
MRPLDFSAQSGHITSSGRNGMGSYLVILPVLPLAPRFVNSSFTLFCGVTVRSFFLLFLEDCFELCIVQEYRTPFSPENWFFYAPAMLNFTLLARFLMLKRRRRPRRNSRAPSNAMPLPVPSSASGWKPICRKA